MTMLRRNVLKCSNTLAGYRGLQEGVLLRRMGCMGYRAPRRPFRRPSDSARVSVPVCARARVFELSRHRRTNRRDRSIASTDHYPACFGADARRSATPKSLHAARSVGVAATVTLRCSPFAAGAATRLCNLQHGLLNRGLRRRRPSLGVGGPPGPPHTRAPTPPG